MGREFEGGVAQLAAFDAAEALVGQVAQAGRELQAQQIEEGKHDIGVAVRVGGVFEQGQLCFVAQHLVEHISGVARGRGNGPATELGVLVGGVGIKGQALPVAEVAGDGAGVANLAADGEALAIGGGERAPAPVLGQPLVVLVIDQAGSGALERVFP